MMILTLIHFSFNFFVSISFALGPVFQLHMGFTFLIE